MKPVLTDRIGNKEYIEFMLSCRSISPIISRMMIDIKYRLIINRVKDPSILPITYNLIYSKNGPIFSAADHRKTHRVQ
jgi:hypothetical protein